MSVCLNSASRHVRDRHTSRAELIGLNTGHRPNKPPHGHRLFLARFVLPQDNVFRAIKSFF